MFSERQELLKMSAITLLLVLSLAALGSAVTPGVTTFTLEYEKTEDGCMVDRVPREEDETFTVTGSGPCITYKCQKRKVRLVTGSSSCQDGDTCNSGEFTSGCNTYTCAVAGQTKRNDQQVIVTQTVALVGTEQCYVRGGCYSLDTEIPTSAGTCVCASSTDITCEPNLLVDPSVYGQLG
ncbi:uncharacterized protein LOC124134377 [Haliotis rufescens]|uniref:uncharacterized protein LOC124134377 n=1 Tax=Haliotis rufescens TaxID=6454 RepID=UPI00201F228B|nr:uncharacterized protein LOC124134377 [Haliotis rufescens]